MIATKKNHFELDFDKSLTKLSGFDLGKDMFDEQIKNKIDYNDGEINIIIPKRVDLIGSSFIQGFFEDIIKNIGLSGIEEKVTIDSSISDAKTMIIDNLN